MEISFKEFVDKLTMMDDILFRVVCKNNIPFVQELLRIIMQNDTLIVEEMIAQDDMMQLGNGRSVVLDVTAVDSTNCHYNIEIQNNKTGGEARRARYHSSIIDTKILDKGQDFIELPECYVIMFCDFDYFKFNEAIYHIERTLNGKNIPFNDGSHIIYVNGTYKGDDMLGKLIHDFHCNKTSDMYYPFMKENTLPYKETKEGESYMSDLIQELYNKGIDVGKEQGIAIGEAKGEARGIAIGEAKGEARGIAIGKTQNLIENINSLLKNGMPLENVLSALEVSKEEYEQALQIVENLETGK